MRLRPATTSCRSQVLTSLKAPLLPLSARLRAGALDEAASGTGDAATTEAEFEESAVFGGLFASAAAVWPFGALELSLTSDMALETSERLSDRCGGGWASSSALKAAAGRVTCGLAFGGSWLTSESPLQLLPLLATLGRPTVAAGPGLKVADAAAAFATTGVCAFCGSWLTSERPLQLLLLLFTLGRPAVAAALAAPLADAAAISPAAGFRASPFPPALPTAAPALGEAGMLTSERPLPFEAVGEAALPLPLPPAERPLLSLPLLSLHMPGSVGTTSCSSSSSQLWRTAASAESSVPPGQASLGEPAPLET